MLEHLKISHRLALAVAMPLLLLSGLAAYMVWGAWAEREEMADLGEFAEGAGKVSRLVHELQRERGLSVIFLGSKGSQMRSELLEQRKRTDKERQDTSTSMKMFAVLDSRDVRDAVAKAESAVAFIDKVRSAVDGQTMTASDSSASYSDTIAKLLNLANSAANMSSRGDVTTAL